MVYPLPFTTVHNLFNLHFAFHDHKIAINLHLEKFCKTEDFSASEMQKLPAKIMKLEGWEILDLAETEFKSWDYEQRLNTIQDWLRAAKQKQVDKGILEANPPTYV